VPRFKGRGAASLSEAIWACSSASSLSRNSGRSGRGRSPARASSSSSKCSSGAMVLHLLAKPVACPLQKGLDLDPAAPELAGDLLDRLPVEVLEHEHLAV
jgi:hypothetical protein